MSSPGLTHQRMKYLSIQEKNLHGALGVDTARWVTSPATFPSTKEYAITNCLVALVTEFQFALKTPFEFRRVSKPFTIV